MHFRLPAFAKNKYLIAFTAVFVWMLFFDKNNLIQQYRLHKQQREMQREKQYYLEEIRRDSTDLHSLQNDLEALERYARENYLMKKEGEDIYIIPDQR